MHNCYYYYRQVVVDARFWNKNDRRSLQKGKLSPLLRRQYRSMEAENS